MNGRSGLNALGPPHNRLDRQGLGRSGRTPLPVRATMEDRLRHRIERLTLFRAVRMVATVALSLAFVGAILEWAVDPGDRTTSATRSGGPS